ncbi:MAG TPA: hypothetical protein VMN37_06460 [Gemmatimonadales bacterium]|nr:hypothetical protein [Gemmatimonadales bacterium]
MEGLMGAWDDQMREAWIQGVQSLADAFGWATLIALIILVPLVVIFARMIHRRRFWCGLSERDVEVEFEESGFPGFSWASVVRSCSAFDPPTAVTCERRCVDAGFRRRCAPALSARMKIGRHASPSGTGGA